MKNQESLKLLVFWPVYYYYFSPSEKKNPLIIDETKRVLSDLGKNVVIFSRLYLFMMAVFGLAWCLTNCLCSERFPNAITLTWPMIMVAENVTFRFLLEEWTNTVARVVILWMIMTVDNDKTKLVYSADAAVCGTCNENNYQWNSIFVKNVVNLLLKATMACIHSVILIFANYYYY